MLYREDDSANMNSKLDISLLYDFYGELLNDSQRQVVELSVNEDLSLAEVAEILLISRQGVRDSLSRAQRKLIEYESKLGLLQTFQERHKRDDAIRALITQIKDTEGCENISKQLDQIEELLKGDD